MRFIPQYLLKLTIIGFLLITVKTSYSQQDPHFSHYMFNQSLFNPANYGMDDGISVVGIYRNQWLGFKDPEGHIVSPVSIQLTADSPIRFLHGGLGVAILQDKLGFTTNLDIKVGYAFHANIGSNVLSIGVNADLNNISHDYAKYITTDNEPVSLGGDDKGIMLVDMAAGILFKNPKYYFSLSSNKVLETEKDMDNDGRVYLKNNRHYYSQFGYQFSLPEYPSLLFIPSIMLYSDGKVFQTQITAAAKYNNKVWGGVGYRLQDAFCFMVGTEFNDIKVGYSFELPMHGLGIRSFGSHEIMIKYLFKLERQKTNTGYRNTRFL